MKKYRKLIAVGLLCGMGLSAYAASTFGLGMQPLRNQQTMTTIQNNCPDYYQNKDGRCLGRTFRSYFLIRSISGGGFGSGK
ncbi:MAG: hypothetical protein MRZ79_14815 [Bacteroidia bacterium]|nr:hypothetical protein [Bacteroidia bacterium]